MTVDLITVRWFILFSGIIYYLVQDLFNKQKEPEKLFLFLIILGFVVNIIDRSLEGFIYGIVGLILGGAPFYAIYLKKGMSLKEVKMMSLVGINSSFPFILLTYWYTSIIGTLVAFFVLLGSQKGHYYLQELGRKWMNSLKPNPSLLYSVPVRVEIPYSLAICLGFSIAFVESFILV